MLKISKFISSIIKDERGASAIEYGLIAALIAAVIAISAKGLGSQVSTTLADVCKSVNGGNSCSAPATP